MAAIGLRERAHEARVNAEAMLDGLTPEAQLATKETTMYQVALLRAAVYDFAVAVVVALEKGR